MMALIVKNTSGTSGSLTGTRSAPLLPRSGYVQQSNARDFGPLSPI
jgi:hypothetical protein